MSFPRQKLLALAVVLAVVAVAVIAPALLPSRTPPTTAAGVAPVAVVPVAAADAPPWEVANPLRPLPKPPAGIDQSLTDLADSPTPERVRLGRWLFFDKRLSG